MYVADPWCGFGLDVAGGKAMFAAARQLADPDRVARMRPDLPVYVVVGERDPVNGGLALVHELVRRYEAAGLTDVTLVSWPKHGTRSSTGATATRWSPECSAGSTGSHAPEKRTRIARCELAPSTPVVPTVTEEWSACRTTAGSS